MIQPTSTLPDELPPFPDVSLVVKVAGALGRTDVIDLLKIIATEVLGDAFVVYDRAQAFARNESFELAGKDMQAAAQQVAGVWSGYGHAQFDKHAGSVVSALGANQNAVRAFADTLLQAAATVVHVYADLVDFVGQCAANLAGLGGKIAIALVTSGVPVLNLLTLDEVLSTITDAFSTFMSDATTLIANGVRTVGDLMSQAVSFDKAAASFEEIPALGSGGRIGDPKYWEIIPSADPEPR